MSKNTSNFSVLSETQNPDRRLTVREVAALLGIGVSTTWQMVKDGRLVAPERYGARCTRWKYSDVIDSINAYSDDVA